MAALLISIGLLALAGFGIASWHRRRTATEAAFPSHWRELIERRLPHYARLDAQQRGRLQQHVRRFIAHKQFHGCNGLAVTEEMRVLIAGLACLLVLRPDAKVFPRLRSVLIYPEAFWVHHPEPDELGLVSDEPELQIGESWSAARVILSW
ncbi:MAG: zinc-dependent peptidase, partial [Nevskiales bacterium]